MAKPKMTEDIIKKGRRDLSEQGHFQELRKGLNDGIIVPSEDSTIATSKHSNIVSSNHSTIISSGDSAIVSSKHNTIVTDKQSKKTTSLRIPNDIYTSIRTCFENEIPINTFFIDAIEREVKKIRRKNDII